MSLLLKIGGLQKLPSVVLLKVEVLFMEERTDVADSRTLQVICSRVRTRENSCSTKSRRTESLAIHRHLGFTLKQ